MPIAKMKFESFTFSYDGDIPRKARLVAIVNETVEPNEYVFSSLISNDAAGYFVFGHCGCSGRHDPSICTASS